MRVGDDDWAEIERRAVAAGETVSAYLRRRALEPDSATRRDLAAIERELRELRAELARRLEAMAADVRTAGR